MLSLQAIRKSFAKRSLQHPALAAGDAVAGVDLEVARGELLTLLGPSGCGKTTLLRCIAGFETPDAGSICIDGVSVAAGGRELIGASDRGIGFVPQDGALFPHLSVNKNVAFGLSSTPRAARRRRVAEVLDLVGLTDMGSRRPHELSGGQQQRVALARAIAPSPRIVLLDEPFSALDAYMRASLRDEVHRILRDLGITAVMVTHDQEEALTVADRLVVMDNGEIRQVGSQRDLYERPADRFVAGFVGRNTFLPGRVTAPGAFESAGGLAVSFADGPGPGPAVLAVRPESIHIEPAEAEANAHAGQVEFVSYLGPVLEVHVRLNPADKVVVHMPNRVGTRVEMGERVRIGWARESSMVFAGEA